MRKHFHLISPQPPSPRSWLNVTVETAGKQRCLCWVFTRHTPAQTRDQREGWWPLQREREDGNNTAADFPFYEHITFKS